MRSVPGAVSKLSPMVRRRRERDPSYHTALAGGQRMQGLDAEGVMRLESARSLPQRTGETVPVETFLTTCWNCLGEFDALNAVWCSDDPKNPTKLCPFCFRCFCAASEKYKQEFWRRAPQRMQDELATLQQEQGPAGRRAHPHEEDHHAAAAGGAGRAEEHRQAAGRDPGRPRPREGRRRRGRAAHPGREPADRHMGDGLRGQPGVGAAATPTRSSTTSSTWPRARARPTCRSSPRRTRSRSSTASTASSSAWTPSPSPSRRR